MNTEKSGHNPSLFPGVLALCEHPDKLRPCAAARVFTEQCTHDPQRVCLQPPQCLFHVLLNSFLKLWEDNSSSVLLMMVVTIAGMSVYPVAVNQTPVIFLPSVLVSAFLGGFFFFLNQDLGARV